MRILSCWLAIIFAVPAWVSAQVTVPMSQYDYERTGANLQEWMLNPSNVTLRLKWLRDDGNVRFMLFKANHALEKVADYTKLPDDTWVVEVRALRLRVSGPSPSECRFRLLAEFDERMAHTLRRKSDAPKTAPLGCEL
jgi:hypothetical protein